MSPSNQLPWWVLPCLGAGVLTIFGGALVASCFLGDSTLQTTMFTASVTMATGVVAFYWGSSASSQKKDETIASQGAALATSAPAAPVITTTTTEAAAPGDPPSTTTTTATGPVPAPPQGPS
jgi:hypothetical protein